MKDQAIKDIEMQENQVDTQQETPATQAEDISSLSEYIREQVAEEDTPISKSNLSLKRIIGGDILTAEIVRKQIWLVLLITLFIIVYIAQGYSYKKYLLEIDKKTTQLKDAKYRALSIKSELTEHTRESRVLDMLQANKDTTLMVSDRPPFIIAVPEE